ncbi:MAG: FAD-dependent oxidoreductase [Phycisphaerae bacterium]|nr:FAD-dependent oxidoreductase [Phycisphaerae bacterium]
MSDQPDSKQEIPGWKGRPRVVIVGAGFGGLCCAKGLSHKPVDVLLVDRQNFHLFTPMIYQVATALLGPANIAYPIRKIFRKVPNVHFQQSSVNGVDYDRKVLKTDDGSEIPYDYLVLGTGSVTNTHNIEQINRWGIGLKDLEDAIRLRTHVLCCLEMAERTDDPEEIQRLLSFTIVGGGPTGVEYAGALTELIRRMIPKEYKRLRQDQVSVHIVEGGDHLISMMGPKLSAYAEKVLRKKGVTIKTGVMFKDADAEGVSLSDGTRIECRTLVWVAGVMPSALAGGTGSELTEHSHRLKTDEYLRVEGQDHVFGIGDIAATMSHDKELPMLATPAMQGGRYVAKSILAEAVWGKEGVSHREPFKYVDKGSMATIGRSAAVVNFHGLQMKGLIAWFMWLLVHVYYLVGFSNRVTVLVRWWWYFLTNRRSEQLIIREKTDDMIDLELGPKMPGISNGSRSGT